MTGNVAELVRRVRECRDPANVHLHVHAQELADTCERLADAARRALDWYDRDGSVGGACDPMEALRAALQAHIEEKR